MEMPYPSLKACGTAIHGSDFVERADGLFALFDRCGYGETR
jgi:hypothetical protein